MTDLREPRPRRPRRRRPSSCPPGRSATPAPGSRCSASPACRATRSRRSSDAAQVHRLHRRRAAGLAAHPVGPGRRLRQARRARRRPRRRDRRDQLQPVPGRRLQARLADPRRPGGPAPRRSTTTLQCIDVMRADRLDRPEDLAARRHQLPGPGRPARPPGPARRLAAADLRRARRRAPAAARVQVLRAVLLRDGRPRLGHLAACTAWPSATRPRSSSTPATTRRAPTSSSSSCSCCASAGSAPSTSTRASTPTTT